MPINVSYQARRTKLVQHLVVPDGQLQVSGNDTRLLVVTGGVTSQLENLGREVLQDGGEVDGGTGTDTLYRLAGQVGS